MLRQVEKVLLWGGAVGAVVGVMLARLSMDGDTKKVFILLSIAGVTAMATGGYPYVKRSGSKMSINIYMCALLAILVSVFQLIC